MKIYRSFDEIEFNPSTVLTVGTFDGVHLGHKFIINNLIELGKEHNLRSLLLTIHPHPQIVLKKSGKPPVNLLTSLDERLELFDEYGVENVLIIPFDYEFSQISARSFAVDYLIKKIGLRKILIGYDHLFGKDRVGNENLLKELAKEHEFVIERLPRIGEADHVVSSTSVRNAIINSDLAEANKLLGYHYSLRGTVVHGLKRGRTLGFPTANIQPDDDNKLLPPNGVYFVYSEMESGRYYGMTNIGFKPTVTNDKVLTIETNFFDFDYDIYDEIIKIHFVKKIRDEKKFNSLDELKNRIQQDKIQCLELKSQLFS
ncbi:MAG: riboflavin biosynthesis protein RibF [Candidatus Kapaibacterium sp.]|jgi:riboflavin kinase/FMN adenylyltransferase|nr:riboflavin biosynthesis protein RibF [Candidatus Kapabacteria bacterium]